MNVFAAATTRHRHRRAAQATTAPVMMMAASSTVPVTHMSSAMSVIVIAASSAPRAPWPAAAARVLSYTLQRLGQQRVQRGAGERGDHGETGERYLVLSTGRGNVAAATSSAI